MDLLKLLAKQVEEVNLAHPKKLRYHDEDSEYVQVVDTINKLLESYKKQQATTKRLNENFTKTQSNLLESQKMAKVGSFEYDMNTGQLTVSAQMYRILGIKSKEGLEWKDFLEFIAFRDKKMVLQELSDAVEKGSRFTLRHKLYSQKRSMVDVETRVKVRKKSGGSVKVIGTVMDISSQMEAKKTIEYLAFHDSLTGLANRRLLHDRLEEAIALAKRYEHLVGVLFLDVDRFKFINDSLGHDIGDKLIKKIANVLKSVVRESDTISRLGGDEFVIVLPHLEGVEAAETVAKKINTVMKQPFNVADHTLFATMSIGIAVYPNHSSCKDEVIKYADAAMYRAKEMGRNNYQVYEMNMTRDLSDQLSLEQDLRRALKTDDEIQLYYQPKVNLKTGKIIGAEGLVRWEHPQLGVLYPDRFISLAENTGMIIPIGQKVLELAAKEIKAWEKHNLAVAVNLSGRQFQHGSLVEDVKNIIEKYEIDPKCLELEITETISMNNVQNSIRILKDLKALGVTLSIDDFGTGYSSLSYLKKLPVDVLKIDREFVMDLHKDKGDVMISKAIIGMGKSLDYKIVAEGIEKEEHTEILNSMECEYGQGFFYSKAVAKADFDKLLEQNG